jgi:enoyl-[acyl-carrier protein] reductase/trans-2-enoyl-CoA reductase (NAD+)
MAERVISPRGRGFLFLDSHPAGCRAVVRDLVAQAAAPSAPAGRRPVALIIGTSAGYGLATAVAGIVAQGIDGVGVCFERAATPRLSATAGWYRVRELADVAREHGARFDLVNGDCFTDENKAEVIRLLDGRQVDYLVYSVAAPRRTDPVTGVTYQSAIKTLGQPLMSRTLSFDSEGAASLTDVEVPAATDEERDATIKVMGGEDWLRWVDALGAAGALADGFTTVALSYIGSELTAGIYRRGTIGAAKENLEATARVLDARPGVRAFTSVNAAAVTQASTHIPGIAYYVVLLREVLGEGLQSPVAQSLRLWRKLTGAEDLGLDPEGRIRLDDFELDPAVQAEVAKRWESLDAATVTSLPAVEWFHDEVLRLYGFAVPTVDYDTPVEVDLPWPA